MDCFALTFDWQRSFETFVAIVQADKANQPRGPIPSYVRPENAAPLSRLDLPRILDAIGELHRTIENPPATNWKAPVWLVEQYKQTAAGKLPLKDGEQPHHSWLIFAAATEVLNRLTPPWHHRKDDCPEITESSLDQKHKVKLIELRNRLSEEFFGQILADNRSVALQTLHYLESLIMDLTGKEGDRPAPNITYINYGINKGIMGDANQQVNADSFNTDVHAADVSKPQEAKGAKCARPTQVPNEAD
ncbi:MAG: hypothetical protein HY289_04205 [Planctomycetes bacterium]|nr:hypothetical protein [Planctomycetota bacterium]